MLKRVSIAAGLASQLLELKVVVQALSKLMMNRQQIRLEFEKMPEMRRAPTEKGFCKKENPAPAFFHLVPVHSSVYVYSGNTVRRKKIGTFVALCKMAPFKRL